MHKGENMKLNLAKILCIILIVLLIVGGIIYYNVNSNSNSSDGKDNTPKIIEEKANTQGKETNNIVSELKNNDTDYNAEANKKYSIKNEDVNNNDKNGGNYNINVTSKEDDHETANNNGHCGEKKLSEKKCTEGIDSKNVEGKKEYDTEEKKDANKK